MKNTTVKNIGRLGRRVLIEYLLIRYTEKLKIDYTISLSIGSNYGLGISLLGPFFLIEINLLPLAARTQTFYLENGE